jgi:gliding motility-associated-like protein
MMINCTKYLIIFAFLFSAENTFSQNYILNNTLNNSTVNTCSGTFYDSGGANNNYGNNQTRTVTFCSTNPNDAISLVFNQFDLENNWDYIYIYNGPNITSPLLGSYTGTSLNGSTIWATSGCITIRFESDFSITASGWIANIVCGTAPTPPSCATLIPAGNSCASATPICDLNGYCGTTNSTYTVNTWQSLTNAFSNCGTIHNNSFFSFVAAASTVSLDVWISNCSINWGIQFMIFSSSGNCSGNVTSYLCQGQMPPGYSSVDANGLTIGNTYYLMVDGGYGDVCDYIIGANSSSGILLPVSLNTNSETICNGSSTTLIASGGDGIYTWSPSNGLNSTTGNSVIANPSITTTYTVTSSSGNTLCPTASTEQAIVNVNYSTTSTDNVGTHCDSYTWIDGITYTTSNNSATFNSINADGCTHTETLNLIINNSTSSTDNVGTHCDSYTWIDGITYTASNNSATFLSTNAAGCTHTETLNLIINNSTASTDNVGTHCDSYTWIDGVTYTVSNNSATFLSTNTVGCTHTETLNLIINNTTTSIDNVGSHCYSYTWINGITYTSSNNTATWITINPITGCDNIATLDLNVNNSTTSIDNVGTNCDSYTWIDGITYTSSNNSATWTTTNPITGCDNIATLDLIINNSTTFIDNIGNQCDSYTWIDGITYTTSNNSATYTTANPLTGCDITATLDLTINNSTSSIYNEGTHCDSFNWTINNQNYNSSGTYINISTNAAGCIHTDTLNVIINNSTSNIITVNECDSYTWPLNNQTYNTSGNYLDVSTNTVGCTHTETLDLIIGYTDDINLVIDENNISCFGYNDGSIILSPVGGNPPYNFLWDNGSTNQSLFSLSEGNYSFSITDQSGCTVYNTVNIEEANQIFLDFIATSPICRNDESTLSINISNSNFNSYTVLLQDSILKSYIIDTNGLLIATGLPIILTPNFSCDPVIISLTDENGCTTVVNDNVHIEVKQLPVLAVNEADICIGTPSFTLINATPTGGSYKIEGVSTDFFDASNLNPGNYNITYSYTDPITSCSNQTTEILTISDSPRADMLFSPQPANISDPNIFFRDNSNEEVLISEWDLGDGTIIYDDLSFWHTYNDIGSYTIRYYITNLYGCTDSVVKQLNINPNYSTFIPNSFTPNNDGDNDVFFPHSLGYKSYNIKIFDRWGGIIFDEDDLAWDGNANGKIIGGLYSYSIKILDFKDKPFIYTGIVNLIR